MKEVSIISKVVSRGKAEALPSASASMPNWAELAKYVTIDGDETINGVKDFTNGLMIDGLGITKLQDDVVYLDAHLVVRGGITMFGTGEDVDVPTIMDALSVDGVNLQVINGVLTFVGEATGGVADSVRWENVIGRPTLLSSFTDDVVAGKYLPLSGGTLTGSGNDILVINRTNGSPFIRFLNNGSGLAYFGVNTSKEMVFIPQNSTEILKVLHSGNCSDYTAGSAIKLQMARTIWGQSFDGTGNVDGNLTMGNTISPTKIKSFVSENAAYTTIGGEEMPFIINNTTGGISLWRGDNNRQLSFNRQGTIIFNTPTTGGWASSFAIKISGGQLLSNVCGAYGSADVMTYTFYGGTYDKPNMVILPNGDVGIGTASPSSASRLHIKGSTGVQILLESSAVECGIRFVTANSSINGRGWIGFSNSYGLSLYNYNSASYGFCMYDNGNVALCQDKGNVGIGTDSPSSKLDVKGGVSAQSYGGYNGNTTASSYRWAIYQWNNELQITRRDSSNTYLSTMLGFDLQSGNVGISVPVTPFGEFTLSTLKSKSNFCLHHNNVFGVYMMVDYNSGAFAIQSGYQNQAKALDIALQPRGGKVGIGTIAPSCSLHVVGDILSTGGITMYSDARKKTILNHVELSLKQIADAPLIEHYYNSDESKTTHVGSIAQYWADLNDWFCKKDNEGFYTMEIQNAALASAISIARELQRYESKTDKKIRLLKKRIGELEEEIEKIKTA